MPAVEARFRYDFEKLLPTYDEALAHRLRYREYSFYYRNETFVFSYHYFKDGVEVGYYIPSVEGGFIFKTPRVWDAGMKSELTKE